MPFAIIGSVLLCILLYCGLEIAFIGALSPADLTLGWAHLSFHGISGPFAGLATILGLTWLAALLYVDAAISPGGTGVVYVTTASRVIFATADEGLASKHLARVTRGGVPVAALGLSFVLGLAFLMLGPVWAVLARYLTSIGVLAYGVGPLVLICFRTTLPEAEFPRPFKLAYAQIFGPLAFIVANFVVFWAGADVANHLFGGLLIAFIIYIAWQFATHRGLGHLAWRGAWWLAPYFTGIWLITFYGPKSLSGGNGALSGPLAAVLLIIFSLVIIALARFCAMPDPAEAKTNYSRHSREKRESSFINPENLF